MLLTEQLRCHHGDSVRPTHSTIKLQISAMGPCANNDALLCLSRRQPAELLLSELET